MGLKESYKDFHVAKIDDYVIEEYFSTEELDFARVEDVIIVPRIHAINHGEYIIDIKTYSQTGTEQVTVKNVIARAGENVFYKQETEQEATFSDSNNGIYMARAKGEVFYETDVDLSHGKQLFVTVQVQVEKDGQVTSKEINYEITITQYWSLVAPT